MLAPLNLCRRFQSTLPARGATSNRCYSVRAFLISIHAPRTGSDQRGNHGACVERISIHAPRTGSDPCTLHQRRRSRNFNPRSPHGERLRREVPHSARKNHFNPRSPHGERPRFFKCFVSRPRFQSTLPARGATIVQLDVLFSNFDHFNPRSPHGERPSLWKSWLRSTRFQSTLPARGATWQRRRLGRRRRISIHAPRTGSD